LIIMEQPTDLAEATTAPVALRYRCVATVTLAHVLKRRVATGIEVFAVQTASAHLAAHRGFYSGGASRLPPARHESVDTIMMIGRSLTDCQ
jgi:hypothetical protein